jgi:2-dehydropantoate 2-reductase
MPEHHWHILGAGAIGCLVAHALAGAGCEVTVLLRPGATRGPRPLVVEREGHRSEHRVNAETTTAVGEISRLVVTTKAYDALQAVQALAPRLTEDTEILLLVNGMGVAEQLAAVVPTSRVFAGTTTEGAYRIAPLHIRHAGRGTTRLGQLGTDHAPLAAHQPAPWFGDWRASELDCTWDTAIEAALWNKLAVNCVINPLTALHRCRNGELASRPELAAEVDALCREIMQVSYAAGFTETAQRLDREVASVIAGTAGNRSSMLEDVERARATEIDYITGYLLQVAERHGIVAPRNRELYRRIRELG